MTEIAYPDLTIADVQRFLIGKHLTGCPACGHRQWRLEKEATSLACHQVLDKKLHVIVIVCANCGMIGMHDRGIVTKWLECHRSGKST